MVCPTAPSLLRIRAENLAAAAMQAMRPLGTGEKHEGAFAGHHRDAASLAKFERAEAGGALPRPAAAKAPAAAAPAPSAPPVAAVHAVSAGGSELEQLWSKLVDAIGRASPFVRSYFTEAHPVALSKTLLTIGFDPEFAEHIAFVDNAKNRELLQTKLTEMG